jgi:uridine kinase
LRPTARSDLVAHVADLLTRVPARNPLRVAVDGITASGKTTFADEVADAVREHGRQCLRVSMDGFHNHRAVRYRRGRASAAGYYDDAYDVTGLRRVLLDPLGPTGDRQYRTATHDLTTDAPVHENAGLAPPDLVLVVDGTFLQRRELADAWDVVVFLRVGFATARARGIARDAQLLGSETEAGRLYDERYHAACRRYVDEVGPEHAADVVVDNDDPAAPQLVHVAAELTRMAPHLRRTRAFFGARAAGWDERFPDDDAAYGRAVAELAPRAGGVVADLGCGTGRALPYLREAVGRGGEVFAVDATVEMLHAARDRAGRARARIVLADAATLPFTGRSIDAFFAAGLLTHVPDASGLLRGLARLARPGCRLALFHPIGRATLARRHGRTLRPDELLDPSVITGVLAAAGWTPESVDDAADRYLARAVLSP